MAGAVVGSAAGDALGAPFEFGPAGVFTARFPDGVGALRTTDTFERALAAAVDVGGDTDTVAAVTGGLAGAVHGIGTIPARWTEPLHLPMPGHGDRRLTAGDLRALAGRLDSEGPRSI